LVIGFSLVLLVVLKGGDLGSAVVIGLILMSLIYLAGANFKIIAGLGGIGILGVAALIMAQPYRIARFTAFVHPFADGVYKNAGWQPAHSLMALGSGGLFGSGIGAGKQKWGNLAEAHTDFIFGVIGEELGLFGTVLTVSAISLLVFSIIKISLSARDNFSKYLGLGIAFWIGFQSLINLLSATSLIPVVGVTLPFISYGGSSLLATVGALGFVAGIALRNPQVSKELNVRWPERSKVSVNRILFAGGGTAGHIEPAWAVSQVWQSRHPGDEIAFLGTKSGLEVTLIPERGGLLFLIPKVVAPRKLNFDALLFPFKIINSAIKTISIVKRFDVVVGFGGYVSASAYLAAAILRKPIVIHDQNAKIGLANKFGAIFTKEIAVAYQNSGLTGAKVVGNPLKREIVQAAVQKRLAISKSKSESCAWSLGELVLILGGSTGSVTINKVIKETNFADRTVIHSLGKANELPAASSNYRPVKYIDDMATALLAADLVISRSGAIACSEFAALGKYALFIPLPIGNGEQSLNADELVMAHKAEVVPQKDFTANWLNQNLERLLKQGSIEPLGTSLNAAELIADCIGRVI
jgi:UDP-N-acetylglucosamine--N-acetylmuramyl-(pentapeptide) pyrophosphoryl-undecaprenol N-acetylglucosamine transferase